MSTAERVVGVRKAPSGNGQQFELKWPGQEETTWEAASRVRRQMPLLVQAFEQHHQQQEGATDDDAPMLQAVVAPSVDSSMGAQMAALEQLVRDQAQQMRAQAEQLQQLRASPTHSPQPSPQHSPSQQQQSRFAKKEPRAQDLKEYDGAPGAKLDEWLQELGRAIRLFRLNDAEAVDFGMSRLVGAALQWSLALTAAQQASIADAASLATALRQRFQPITSDRLAREQLRSLRQGSRGINDYIADFQRLHALLPDMSEKDTLFAFESGVGGAIAMKLREHGVATLADAIALAARIGGLSAAAASSPSSVSSSHSFGRQSSNASAHQMEFDNGSEDSLEERVTRTVLNALQSQQQQPASSGVGAKTQTQRGYQQDRSNRGGVQQSSRGRGGRYGGAPRPPPVITIPGVPDEVIQERRAAKQCLRCGSGDHFSYACPNAISARPLF